MKAGIIAAGQGQRLMQGGIHLPKPLIPVSKEPLIARVIRAATYVNATSVACIVNDLNPAVPRYLRSTPWPVPLELIVKTTPSSMESLFALAPVLRDESFLLLTVDSVFEFKSLKRFLTKARGMKGDGVLAVTRFVDDERPLWVKLDRSHKILDLGDSIGPWPCVTAGFYYFKPGIFEMIEAARAKKLKALREFLGLLLENGYSLYGLLVSKTIDVDYPEDIKKAEKYLKEVGEEWGM